MFDTVNPNNYWDLTTFKSVILKLTRVRFRLTVVFCHFTISCFKHGCNTLVTLTLIPLHFYNVWSFKSGRSRERGREVLRHSVSEAKNYFTTFSLQSLSFQNGDPPHTQAYWYTSASQQRPPNSSFFSIK